MARTRIQQLYSQLGVTDALAAMRTDLALERTLLAHIRTAFATLVTGVTGTQISDQMVIRAASVALIGASLIAFAVGIRRYTRTRNAIAERLEQAVEARRGD